MQCCWHAEASQDEGHRVRLIQALAQQLAAAPPEQLELGLHVAALPQQQFVMLDVMRGPLLRLPLQPGRTSACAWRQYAECARQSLRRQSLSCERVFLAGA